VDEDADRFVTVSDTPGRPWSLFESIPEMVVVVDSDGRILYANHHCAEIVGWTPNELNGRSIETLVPDQLRGLHQSHRRGYTGDPKGRPLGTGLLLNALHRSGRVVPVEIALSPLGGPIAATVATVRDVSDRLETAAQLEEVKTRLEVLDDRDRIARELHDSVIQRLFAAGLQLQASLGQADNADRLSHVVDEIDEAIREIRGVIFTLHRPSRLDSGLEAALRASINEAARMLGHRPTLRLGGILTNIPDDLGSELLAVLGEAMTNVAKHAHATRTEVSLDVGSAVTLVVHDDGVGMASSSAESGGLGLRNVRERASRLGGDAVFLPGEPRGTLVRLTVQL
jgi:two-component system sensor histidine kinase DevS